jgi:hypothetical protein
MRATWILTVLDPHKPEKLGIECPYCREKAIVKRSAWLFVKREYIGRSCTYCFATSEIPRNLQPRHVRERNAMNERIARDAHFDDHGGNLD